MNNINLTDLNKLISSDTLHTLSGTPKQCYRYTLTAIFINIIGGQHYTIGQEENINIALHILRNPTKFKKQTILNSIKNEVQKSLKKSHFRNPYKTETILLITELFRKIVCTKLEGKRYMTLVKELDSIIDMNAYFTSFNRPRPHHWIHISFSQGLVPTLPEFIIYSDIINTWNILLDKSDELINLLKTDDQTHYKERQYTLEARKLEYECQALNRSLLTLSSSYVESYMYYVFYNLKMSQYQLATQTAKEYIKIKKVDATGIIENIIIGEFFTPSRVEFSLITTLLEKYKRIIKLRNRIIHPSAFEEQSQSHLLPLISLSFDRVIDALQTSIELVLSVDKHLPNDQKILYWWENVEHPNFLLQIKGNMVNPKGKPSNFKYYNI